MFSRCLILLIFVYSIYAEGLRWEIVNDLYSECTKSIDGVSTTEKPGESVEEKMMVRASRQARHPMTMNWRAQVERLAELSTESRKKIWYCTFTKLGLLDAKGNIIWESLDGDKACNAQCLQYLADCAISTDTHDIYAKAYINGICVYVSSWAVTGFV